MRKQKLTVVCLAVIFIITAVAVNAGDVAWFDLTNCAMCKSMSETEGLLDHMTWEQYDISNGVVGITSVTDDFKEAYKSCNAAMEAAGEKLMAGEKLPLCGSCMAFTALMAKGAKVENVETMHGHVSIITGGNDELVAEIKAWSAKNNEEMKKFQ